MEKVPGVMVKNEENKKIEENWRFLEQLRSQCQGNLSQPVESPSFHEETDFDSQSASKMDSSGDYQT